MVERCAKQTFRSKSAYELWMHQNWMRWILNGAIYNEIHTIYNSHTLYFTHSALTAMSYRALLNTTQMWPQAFRSNTWIPYNFYAKQSHITAYTWESVWIFDIFRFRRCLFGRKMNFLLDEHWTAHPVRHCLNLNTRNTRAHSSCCCAWL